MPDVAALVDLADRHGVSIEDRWQSSRIILSDGIDIAALDQLAQHNGYEIMAYLGPDRVPVPVGDSLPGDTDLRRAESLATLPSVAGEVSAAMRGTDIVRALESEVDEVEVVFVRSHWARTLDGLRASLDLGWAEVADDLGDVTIEVNGHALALLAEPSPRSRPHGSLPVVLPEAGRPTGEAGQLWSAITSIADAAAWTNLATNVLRDDLTVRVGLHADQSPLVAVTLENSAGGLELFRWWTASKEANREVALRHVLRFVMASGFALPNPHAVMRLAEREHLALAEERAAEIHRAVSEGQRDVAEAMRAATAGLGELIEDSTKTANAAVVAVLGVVVLVARGADDLPDLLVAAVALSAVAGLAVVAFSRLGRIKDQVKAITQLEERLKDDPLLPEEDRAAALAQLATFNVSKRAEGAYRIVTALAAAAGAVVAAAAIWIIFFHAPAEADTPSSSTPTTSTSVLATTSSTATIPTTTTGKPVPSTSPP